MTEFSPNSDFPENSKTSETDREYLDSVSLPWFWASTSHLLILPTLNLGLAMFSCAVFPALFSTIAPMFIGILLQDKRYVAAFGVCAGIGEICGSLFAGKLLSRCGVKLFAGLVFTLAAVSLAVSCVAFPLVDHSTVLEPNHVIFLFLGLCLGMGDATNGVLLSTLIGRVYKNYSQAGFALYSLVFNFSAILLYIFSSYTNFLVVACVMCTFLCVNLIAILFLKTDDSELKE